MFILVSSIGVYLYVNNLEGNFPKKRHDLSKGGALNRSCAHHLREHSRKRKQFDVAKFRRATCEVVDSTG
ncbi:hypothetical protein POVWA2_003630 [Plasmodium ovale wallikeri]|uniref:Uncharacterized protein n=1 Tax=Plasmodium ovale wallikeri TaxID=864142 RepID=A0A1A8YJ14_PLAOA|nr:hypothetical protein POVWA1_003480 [Plasmodium ovale wallikeri]SBT31337.1 hypothetical protein POVWA2_003630 [Plasmodium ovale wallikeri]